MGFSTRNLTFMSVLVCRSIFEPYQGVCLYKTIIVLNTLNYEKEIKEIFQSLYGELDENV